MSRRPPLHARGSRSSDRQHVTYLMSVEFKMNGKPSARAGMAVHGRMHPRRRQEVAHLWLGQATAARRWICALSRRLALSRYPQSSVVCSLHTIHALELRFLPGRSAGASREARCEGSVRQCYVRHASPRRACTCCDTTPRPFGCLQASLRVGHGPHCCEMWIYDGPAAHHPLPCEPTR